MDKVTLPIVPAATPLGEALELLRARGVSGLITLVSGQPVVLDADALLKGIARADTRLDDVAPIKTTVDFGNWNPDLDRAPDSNRTAQLLDRTEAQYGYAGPSQAGPDEGVVVTRSEFYAGALSIQMAYCTCTGPGHHVCAPGDALSPGICNDCFSPLVCR